MDTHTNTPGENYRPPEAPNVSFISSKVQAKAALQEYSRCLKRLFNQSVQMLLLAKNATLTQNADAQICGILQDTKKICHRLRSCSQAAKGAHTSANLFRYLDNLLSKAETEPTIDTFYEIASLAEVLAEGFDAADVS